MKKDKTLNKYLMYTLVIIINLLVISGLGQLFLYLNTGAERSSMLNLAVITSDIYLPKVIWKDTTNPGRRMDESTLHRIESDYLKAFYVKNVAYKTNNAYGTHDYFTVSAQKNIANYINDNESQNINTENTTLNHNLYLDFFSADGQLCVISDRNSKNYERIYKDEKLIYESQQNANYQAILLLEDGFWKTRHLVKQPINTLEETEKIEKDSLTYILDNEIIVNNNPYHIKGINYYPQNCPWNMYGKDFSIKTISKDFKIIKKTGLNTIRVFVGYEDFGKATVFNSKLKKLEKVLNEAEKQGLMVIVTLFDFYGDYSVLDWTLTHRHAEQIVTRFKDHKAILAWDVKNEPNLDFETRDQSLVLAWLKEIITQIKTYDPNHLVTIGWSNIESAHLLKDQVDFISFHYYNKIENFEVQYIDLESTINKPLVLQEYGLSSYKGIWNPLGTTEENQAEYYKNFHQLLDSKNIHRISWTLYDFTDIPDSVVGKFPWRKQQQAHFGFINMNGEKKEAFKYINN